MASKHPDARTVPVACAPISPPKWVMPDTTPRFAEDSLGRCRPSGSCARGHCGVDLVGANAGALVVAPEDVVVENYTQSWSTTKSGHRTIAVYLRSAELFFVLGGLRPKSNEEFSVKAGDSASAGQEIGRVQDGYGMIHFEIYRNEPSRVRNTSWNFRDAPPAGLLNPINYVQAMAARPLSISSYQQIHAALYELGFYDGEFLDRWTDKSSAALSEAQRAYGLKADGKWGEKSNEALQSRIDVRELPCQPTVPADTPRVLRTTSWSRLQLAAASLASVAVLGGAAYAWRRA